MEDDEVLACFGEVDVDSLHDITRSASDQTIRQCQTIRINMGILGLEHIVQARREKEDIGCTSLASNILP